MNSATTTGCERARKYIDKIPSAVSGNGGHDQTFAVACKLVEFGLSQPEAWELLTEYNRRCDPPWRERELEHKLEDAFRTAQHGVRINNTITRQFRPIFKRKPKPVIDPVNATENFLNGFRCDEVDIWEASPIRPPDDWTQDAILLLESLYRPGEQINFVTSFKTDTNKAGDTKAVPIGKGETVERNALISQWKNRGMPASEAGGWVRMNPVDGQDVTDASVTVFRFALVECDSVPLELQLSLFAKLPLPTAAILTSGGRSFHAWVRVDADSEADYRATVTQLLALLSKFGVDGKNKNPSRLSRLPGVVRSIAPYGSGKQRLLYLNPEPEQKTIL